MKRLACAIVFALLAACASAGNSADDDGDSDGSGAADASIVEVADADPNAPDAAPAGTPDAAPGAPDAAPTCSPCQLVSQCGCGMDQACDLAAGNTTECRPVLAPGGEESTCADSTSCAPGFGCIGGAGSSSCMRYCGSDAQCDGTGGLCLIRIVDGTQTPIPSPDGPGGVLTTCSQNCNPETGTGCPATFGCEVGQTEAAAGARDFSVCRKAGLVTQGGACSAADPDVCAIGTTCINDGGFKCYEYCPNPTNPVTTAGCSGGNRCYRLTVGAAAESIIVGGITWGVCAP